MLTTFSSILRMCLSWASANMASHYIWPLTTQWIPSDYSSNVNHVTEIQCGKKELPTIVINFSLEDNKVCFQIAGQSK